MTIALMGKEISDTLRPRSLRESERDGAGLEVPATEGCAERAEVAREIARNAGDGGGLLSR